MLIAPPAASKTALEDPSPTEHPMDICATATVRPPAASEPWRNRPPAAAFAATSKRTVPLPAPERPEVTVIQSSCAVAVHGQPAPAETSSLPVSPSAGEEILERLSEYWQEYVGTNRALTAFGAFI
jgi:hypothetical protein